MNVVTAEVQLVEYLTSIIHDFPELDEGDSHAITVSSGRHSTAGDAVHGPPITISQWRRRRSGGPCRTQCGNWRLFSQTSIRRDNNLIATGIDALQQIDINCQQGEILAL
jgi:hypothetical protein